jgi:hypothetical protein
MSKYLIILSALLALCFNIPFAESKSPFRNRSYSSLSNEEKAQLAEMQNQLWDPKNYSSEIEVSGRLLNMDGSPYPGEAKVGIRAETLENWDMDQGGPPVAQNKEVIFETKSQNGVFSWKGYASRVMMGAEVDGFHSTTDEAFSAEPPKVAKHDDLVIYLIPKGIPSKLEYTEGAKVIKNKKDDKSYGWSFDKRWYYPVDNESVDMTVSFDDKGKPIYTMKEPGGFVYFSGRPEPFTICSRKYWAGFDFMTEAPESGYIPVFALEDYRMPQTEEAVYCYFRTPAGKYGKIKFKYNTCFDYYINPDGSRNLEAGEVEEWDPINPDYGK